MMNIPAVSNKRDKQDTLGLCVGLGKFSHARCDVIVYFGVGGKEPGDKMNLIKQHARSWLLPLVSFQSVVAVSDPLYAPSSSRPALLHIPLLPLNLCFPLSPLEAALKSILIQI